MVGYQYQGVNREKHDDNGEKPLHASKSFVGSAFHVFNFVKKGLLPFVDSDEKVSVFYRKLGTLSAVHFFILPGIVPARPWCKAGGPQVRFASRST